MSNSVKLTVVIPVYNAQDYLHQTLDSLIHQTLREIEIICVDDGSADRSLEILHEYAAKDSRVHVLTQKNQYAGAARNAGMAIARGEYIHFLDADDYMKPDAYEILYARAKAMNADMVKARALCVDAAGRELPDFNRYALARLPAQAFGRVVSFAQAPDWFDKINVVPWNGVYRLDFLRAHSIRFNRLFCVNDRSFFKEILLYAKRIVVIPDSVACHRVNLETSLVGQRAKHFECHFESYRMIERMSRALPPKLRAVYMEPEMNDVLGWYRTFRKGPLGAQITPQVFEFLKDADISLMLKHCRYLSWLEIWIETMEKAIQTPECAEKRAALEGMLKMARRKQRAQNSILHRALRKAERILSRLAR